MQTTVQVMNRFLEYLVCVCTNKSHILVSETRISMYAGFENPNEGAHQPHHINSDAGGFGTPNCMKKKDDSFHKLLNPTRIMLNQSTRFQLEPTTGNRSILSTSL